MDVGPGSCSQSVPDSIAFRVRVDNTGLHFNQFLVSMFLNILQLIEPLRKYNLLKIMSL